MTIGIPKALYYYQYGVLWESFFTELGCNTVVSDNTNEAIFQNGARDSVSECCLPTKAYIGHVRSLITRCEYILSPYAAKESGGKAICTRFWGIGDALRHTYQNVKLLEYAIYENNLKAQYSSFFHMGKVLGKKPRLIRHAYEAAAEAQHNHDIKLEKAQNNLIPSNRLKIMLAGRPYVMHDPYISEPVINILSELECTIFFSNRFDKKNALNHSADISPRLYWTASREAVGAIAAHKKNMDGILMLTVFPCAQDALACEMATRVVKDIPIALITLDGLQGEAGLQTRIESFIEIVNERKAYGNGKRTTGHFVPSHG